SLNGGGGMRRVTAQQAKRLQFYAHMFRHAVVRVAFLARLAPEVMGNEFHEQRLWCGPGQRFAGCGHAPGFEITKIRNEGTQRIFAHAFRRQMAQRLNVVIGENGGQKIPAVEGEDRLERIQRLRLCGIETWSVLADSRHAVTLACPGWIRNLADADGDEAARKRDAVTGEVRQLPMLPRD